MAAIVPLPPRFTGAHVVGRGGMAEVYAAVDAELGRPVAVKLLDARLARDPALRRRFAVEARAAARLSGHPGAVVVHDVGEHDGRPYIVMELVDGGSVRDRIAAADVPLADALRWLEGAAATIDAAHRAGIVHRDVKPENLLLDSAGEVRVADFGIARVLDEDGVTTAGSVLGSTGYLAPEQAAGDPVGPATDVYALGCVAFELLAGSRPYGGRPPAAEAAAHLHEPPPRASARAPGLPPAADAVLLQALAKDPRERPASASAFVARLRGALAPQVDPTAPLPVAAAPRRSRRGAAVVALALLAAAGTAVGVGALSGGGHGPAAPAALRPPAPRTVVTTREVTVPAPAPAPAPAPPAAPAPTGSADAAHALNDRAFGLMREGRFAAALPLLVRAARALAGAGPADPYEAYATYNLGATLLALGRCTEALAPLQRSDALQDRPELTRALRDAERCAGGGDVPGKGKAKGRGKHGGEGD